MHQRFTSLALLLFAGLTAVATWGRLEPFPCVGSAQLIHAAETVDRNAKSDEPAESSEWRPPNPPSAAERVHERHRMVASQIAVPPDYRKKVKAESVLKAMRTAPRHIFVPKPRRRHAYADSPLPIGHGQTISQPYIVAMMTELLKLTPKSKVLEIGTGSGYQAAVLAHLTPHVYSIEIIEPLSRRAKAVLKEQHYDHVRLRYADGYHGWPEEAPFDAIIVTCAAGHLPSPLWQQLKPGGHIVIPIGGTYEVQRLVVIRKTLEGKRESRTVMGVRFVPMTGKVKRKE